ncbi:MAG TPA: hypothetical protein VGE05_07805 [Novosphingobium sp.]
MDIRGFRILRNVMALVLIAVFLAGLFLPVYTDEVGWRFQERAGIDGVDKLYSDGCGINTLAAPPFFMMPIRYYSAFFNTTFADPLYVRLSGIGYALCALVLLLLLIRRIADNGHDRAILGTVAMGLLSLGVMPLLMVWSRPEQPIFIAILSALLIAWSDWRDRSVATPARKAWMRSIGILLMATVAVSYHLKGIFLLPLFLACIFLASRGKAAFAPRLVVSGLLIAMTLWGAHYWSARLQCPDDPILWKLYASHTLTTQFMRQGDLSELPAFILALLRNADPSSYIDMAVPINKPMSFWLEYYQLDTRAFAAWVLSIRFLWGSATILAIICALLSVRTAFRERKLDPRVLIALVLACVVLGWSANQLIRNVYETMYVLPLAMLAIMFGFSAWKGNPRLLPFVRGYIALLAICGIGSCIGLAATYAPSLIRANSQQGYIAAQPYSQTVFGYSTIKTRILAAARQCGIPASEKARAVMIDDVTYFTFMRSSLPQHYLGIVANWKGSIKDPVAYLRSRGSSGAILGCRYLPEDLRRRAKRDGAICCLGPANW